MSNAFVREDLTSVFVGFGSSSGMNMSSSSSFSCWKVTSSEDSELEVEAAFALRLKDFFGGGSSLDLEDAPFLLDEPASGRTRRGRPARSSSFFFPRNFRRPWVKWEFAGGGTPMITG